MKPHIRCLLGVIALVLAISCNNKSEPTEPAPAAEPAQPAPAAEPAQPAEPAEPAEPAKPAEEPAPCIADCLKDNQARATDWEQIKRECEAECSKKSGD